MVKHSFMLKFLSMIKPLSFLLRFMDAFIYFELLQLLDAILFFPNACFINFSLIRLQFTNFQFMVRQSLYPQVEINRLLALVKWQLDFKVFNLLFLLPGYFTVQFILHWVLQFLSILLYFQDFHFILQHQVPEFMHPLSSSFHLLLLLQHQLFYFYFYSFLWPYIKLLLN